MVSVPKTCLKKKLVYERKVRIAPFAGVPQAGHLAGRGFLLQLLQRQKHPHGIIAAPDYKTFVKSIFYMHTNTCTIIYH